MERYLDGETIARDELEATLAGGVAAGRGLPGAVLLGRDRGRRRPAGPPAGRALPARRPAPPGRPSAPATPRPRWRATPPASRSSWSSRRSRTPTPGKISLLQGPLRHHPARRRPHNPRTRTDERLHVLAAPARSRGRARRRGPGRRPRRRARLSRHRDGDTLAPKGTPVVVPRPRARTAALRSPSGPRPRATRTSSCPPCTALGGGPVARCRATTRPTRPSFGVTGEIHLAVTLERLHRKFGVAVEREDVLVPYRETISKAADAEGSHKKQSGGHGQFGVCHLRIEPLGRGEGFASTTRSSVGPSPASTSRRSRRACSRRWPRAASSASRRRRRGHLSTTGNTTPSTRRR